MISKLYIQIANLRNGAEASPRRPSLLAENSAFPYNAQTIPSHVTGEKPGRFASGTRWVPTGKREISTAVRLGSQDGKRFEAARNPLIFGPHSIRTTYIDWSIHV